jgi:phosphonopyruvate decarboxylase
MIPVHSALAAISRRRGDAVVIPTMTTARLWPEHSTRDSLDLPLTGCMGKASSLGLGIALAQPDRKVIVFDGDGSLLMNLGTLVTIANAAPKNLIHCVFENGVYEITGGQPIPGEGTFNLAKMAEGAGYANVYELSEESSLNASLDEAFSREGPTFVVLHVDKGGEPLSRPTRNTPNAWREVQSELTRA